MSFTKSLQANWKTSLLSLLGAGLIYLGALADVPLPFTPVPQSLQTLAIVLIAYLFPKPASVLSVVVYLALGFFGAPVFSDGGSGWSHMIGPTGGYLLGFLIAALYIQYAKRSITAENPKYAAQIFMFFIAHCIILFIGFQWLSTSLGFSEAWRSGVSPFIVGALVKSGLAIIIIFFVQRLLVSIETKVGRKIDTSDSK